MRRRRDGLTISPSSLNVTRTWMSCPDARAASCAAKMSWTRRMSMEATVLIELEEGA